MIIGVDPGQTGSLILMDGSGNLVDLADFVVVKVRKKNQIAMPLVANYIRDNWLDHPLPVAYVELVGSMPQDGKASAFKFGYNTGLAVGMLHGFGLRVERVTPQAWKKACGLIGEEKDATRLWAMERWPKQANWFERKKDIGRADAAAIAWVASQIEKSQQAGSDLL